MYLDTPRIDGATYKPIHSDRAYEDPLDYDRPDDEVVMTTTRGLCRVAMVAAEAAGRFQHEGRAHDPMAWMLAPRQLFEGVAPLEACLGRDDFLRGMLLHGLGLGTDCDPAVIDALLEDGDFIAPDDASTDSVFIFEADEAAPHASENSSGAIPATTLPAAAKELDGLAPSERAADRSSGIVASTEEELDRGTGFEDGGSFYRELVKKAEAEKAMLAERAGKRDKGKSPLARPKRGRSKAARRGSEQKLYIATIAYVGDGVMLQAFHASVASHPAEVVQKLRGRFGEDVVAVAEIREGFHAAVPLVIALVPRDVADVLRTVSHDPGSAVLRTFCVDIEQRLEI